MQCKLSKLKKSEASSKFLLSRFLRTVRLSATFITVAISCATLARAQSFPAEKVNGSISGTVYLPGQAGAATQVAVSVKSPAAGVFRSLLTDYDGHFEVPGLPPGPYEICVEEAGYEALRNTANLEGASVKLELHLVGSAPQATSNSYTISVRELRIPSKAQGEFNKGLSSLAKNDWNGSLAHFTKAVDLFPDYYEAAYHLGVAETNLGQFGEALEAFQKSIDLSGGKYARGDFGIGYVLYLQGKAADAESIIRRGLQLDANAADGYVILGMTLLRLNRADEAEKSAREALLRNPKLANAYLVLADAFARKFNYREQIKGLDTYLKMAPPGPAAERAHQIREIAQRILNESQPKN